MLRGFDYEKANEAGRPANNTDPEEDPASQCLLTQ